MARATPQSLQRYPLTSILGTDAGVRLVRELARHGGQLAAPELVRRTGLAKASVARGLVALEGTGILKLTGTGRGVLYSLRPEHPLVPALASVFEAEEGRFRAIMMEVAGAARSAIPGIEALWLYGSVARGQDWKDSDLDLAFVAGSENLSDLGDAFRETVAAPAERMGFNPSIVALGTGDVVRLSTERDRWWLQIVRDAVVLVGERPEVLASRLARRTRLASSSRAVAEPIGG